MRIGIDNHAGYERSSGRTHKRWDPLQLHPACGRRYSNVVSLTSSSAASHDSN